uniref:Telomerase reverse transcriptase n=1 Tax=Parascaris univalens TaxID=6257 RepID=A0A915BTR0_PARUN
MNRLSYLSKVRFAMTTTLSSIQIFPRLIKTSSIWNIRHYSESSKIGGDRRDDRQSIANTTNEEKKAEGVEKRNEKIDDGRWLKPQGWISRILTGPQGVAAHYLQSHSSLLSDSDFIYELVTHDAKPGELDSYLKLYKNYADEVKKRCIGCDLLGSWKVFYANRDQAVHLWRFKHGYEDIDRAMHTLLTEENLKKLEVEMSNLVTRRREVLAKSFSYWGEPKPRQPSHVYELRTYMLRPGTIIEWGAAWARGIHYRREANQDVGGFFTQIGPLHRVFHLWAYSSLVQRNETRQEMWAKPGWDHTVAYTVPLIKKMDSKILIPTEMSQLK